MGTATITLTDGVPVKIPQPLKPGKNIHYTIITYKTRDGKETLEF